MLFNGLLAGDYPVGTDLNIERLTREFSLPSAALRVALARMAESGLVQRSGLDYRVAPPWTPRELADLMDARLVIEPEMTALACRRAAPDFLAELTAAHEDLILAAAGERPNAHRFWAADERFHRVIARHCGNRPLGSAYTALGGHVQHFRLYGARGFSDAELAIAEHADILAAMRAGDEPAARSAMCAHVDRVRHHALADRAAARP
ncbi:GntR family transcriptional regulator [Mycetocola spongiae]|uniref:GntR family transcriptional regulator n=1 Tax=Mycetocola spongiae TaxID=2859226 RepID=UPI001CF377AB|nr:GntR family transcriptional regulator [Mycetocola spongiae]UCR88527.1 GntR family transcriptional regulator [Mycetocola spongiae]